MSTPAPGFQSFSMFFHHFVLARLATSSIRKFCLQDAATEIYIDLGCHITLKGLIQSLLYINIAHIDS